MNNTTDTLEPLTQAYYAGRRAGLGIAAVALGAVSFISLLGVEKAILAIVLGALALRGSETGTASRKLGKAGVALGALFIVTVVVLLAVFHEQLAQFIALLDKLS